MITLEQEMLDYVNELLQGGPKRGTELVTEMVTYLHTQGISKDVFGVIATIDNWVRNGDIIEVEYILPSMTYRVKSLYFVKGTTIKLP